MHHLWAGGGGRGRVLSWAWLGLLQTHLPAIHIMGLSPPSSHMNLSKSFSCSGLSNPQRWLNLQMPKCCAGNGTCSVPQTSPLMHLLVPRSTAPQPIQSIYGSANARSLGRATPVPALSLRPQHLPPPHQPQQLCSSFQSSAHPATCLHLVLSTSDGVTMSHSKKG